MSNKKAFSPKRLVSMFLSVLAVFVLLHWFGTKTNFTYNSTNLGVSFLYRPISDKGEISVVKELDNKIYVFGHKQKIDDAAYIEVINLEENEEIQKTMRLYVQQHFENDDCLHVYNTQGSYKEGTQWELACASLDHVVRRQSYFLYDKNNPEKFIFVNIDYLGQNGFFSSKNWIYTSDGEPWFTTLELL